MTTSTSFAQMANNQSISLSSALRANTPPTKGQTTSHKFLTLSIFFLLSFFCTTNLWGAEGDTHDFPQSLSQLLNNNASVASIEIAEQSYTIKTVKITSDYNKTAGGVTMEVFVGGISWGTATHNSNAEKTFTFSGTSTKGKVTIKFTNNCGSGTGKGTFKVTTVQLVEGASASATKYKVTFNAGSGTCGTSSLTESTAGYGVTLPTATICDGWEFAGWAISSVATETTTAPTLLSEGSNYKPTGNCTLYAVYQRTEETEGNGGTENVSRSYTFSNFTAGTQYADNEVHKLDNDVTLTTTDCHFTSELRIYSSSTYNGYVVSNNLPGRIVSIGFNAGNKVDAIDVFGSTNGTDWTKVGQVSVTSTSYKDYTLNFGATNYTYFKLDVAGSNQVRLKSITITWESASAGGSTITTYYHSTPDCTPQTPTYTITWKNADGTILETDNNVESGATPQYNGSTPTKAATAQYTYAFTGWNPAIESVTKDQTYTAQFSQTVNKYTITWKNADGTTIKTEEVAYGTTPSYTGTTPTKAATEQYTYIHNGWTPSVVAVTDNATYTATFTEKPRTYTITLNTNDGTINAGNVASYKYGTGATLPINVTKEHHQFGGWFDNSGCIGTAVTTISTTATGNKEYWAKWTELAKYTVTLVPGSGSVTDTELQETSAGAGVTLPTPTLDCGDWEFAGWKTTSAVTTETTTEPTLIPAGNYKPTSNITLYAVYSKTEIIQGGGSVETKTVTLSTPTNTQGYKPGTKTDSEGNTWSYYAAINNQSGTCEFGLNADDKNYHIASPEFTGVVTSVSFKARNASSSESRKFLFCSSNSTAKPSTGDLAEVTIPKNEQYNNTYTADLSASSVSQFYIYTPKALGITHISVTYTTSGGGSTTTTTYNSNPECGPQKLATPNVELTYDCSSATITWDAVTNAKAYWYQIIKTGDTKSGESSGNKTYTRNGIEPGVSYTWSVKAIGDGSKFSDSEIATGTFTAYSIQWLANGELIEKACGKEGEAIVVPTPNPASCDDAKEFVGWTATPIDGSIDTEPNDLFTESPGDITGNATYYAVFATVGEGGGEIAELVKMTAYDDFNIGDKIVIIAEGTQYGLYQKTSTSNYIDYWTTQSNDGVPTLAEIKNDSKRYVEVSAGTATGTIKLGDASNGYLYNSSSTDMSISTNNSSDWSIIAWTDNRFTFEARQYLSCRTDLSGANENKWRGAGANCDCETGNSCSGVIYYNVYKYISGSSTTYSGYVTTCDNTKATITYDLNGGTGATCEQQTVTKGEAFTLCNQTPTKTGYNFAGWTDGVNTYDEGASTSVTDNTKFYAKWTVKTIIITWNQNYTGCPDPIEMQYVYDSDENTMPEEPVREGYQFVGWFTGIADGIEITEIGEENRPTDDVTYYAHWNELYSVTFMVSGQVYVVQEDKYINGDAIELPAEPSAANYACDGYVFDGWSALEKPTEDATKPELITASTTINADREFHAVWAKSSTGVVQTDFVKVTSEKDDWTGDYVIVNEDAEKAIGNAYKENNSSNKTLAAVAVTIADNKVVSPSEDIIWQIRKNGENYTIYNAAVGKYAYVTDDDSRKAGLSDNPQTMNISWGSEATKTRVYSPTYVRCFSYYTSNSEWRTYGTSNNSTGTLFYRPVASYTYTTHPNCGPTIVAKDDMWVTSSNGQSVKINVPIAVKSFTNTATITGTSTNENFVVNTLENAGNGEHQVVVVYTPSADDTKENTTITLTAKNGEEIWCTTTFTLNGRSLPDEFVIVAQYGDKWLALPANMQSGADQYNGIEVTPNNALTQIPAAPSTTIYSLRGVADNRYEDAGTCVRLVGNGNKCLWGNAATTNTTIQNWTTLGTTNGSNYEWLLTTSDGELYTIANPEHPDYDEGRILSNSGSKYGLYKGTTKFYILPVGCSSLPGNIQVTARRVDATFSWEGNASSMQIDIYTNEGMTEGHISNTATASPYYMTGLSESTQYWFKMTPNGTDDDCAYIGTFKTTGPTIDVVEWQESAAVIFVDKDENLDPVVVIDGEVEHGVGGTKATDIFFSKYFEAQGTAKLLAIYNGTANAISLADITILQRSMEKNTPLSLVNYGKTKGWIQPSEEIILYNVDAREEVMKCAEEDKTFESWNNVENNNLAFSGKGTIRLFRGNKCIDIIGAMESAEDIHDKKVTPLEGTEEPTFGDELGFTTATGDNYSTPNVETNYTLSTNRCLLVRKPSVTSGAIAVEKNIGDFKTLGNDYDGIANEWAGLQVPNGPSDNKYKYTCEGFQKVGSFDYNQYYKEYQNVQPEKVLDEYKHNDATKEYIIPIENLAKYSCLNIRFQLKQGDQVLTEEPVQVPIIVSGQKETNDAIFNEIVKTDASEPVYDQSIERCKTCNVVVLSKATLTKATDGTTNDVAEVANLKIYPGGQVVVPAETNYNINSLAFRRQEDEVSMANIQGTLNVKHANGVYLDVRIDPSNWHYMTLPYDCRVGDVTFADGTPAVVNTDYLLGWYDGAYRAEHKTGGWTYITDNDYILKKGLGYIVALPGDGKVRREIRFPMANEVIAADLESKIVSGLYAYGGDKTDAELRPNHKGWNMIGSPYLYTYTTDIVKEPLQMGRLEHSSVNPWDGTWVRTGDARYIVEPIDNGWSGYKQTMIDCLKPFTSYFIQVGGELENGEYTTVKPETEQQIVFAANSVARNASAPRKVVEAEVTDNHPVWYGVEMIAPNNEKDNTTLLISDDFTDGYDMMDDLVKMRGDYYQYYNFPVLASNNNEGEMAFNALPDSSAAKIGVPLSYYAATAGTYTIATDGKYDLEEVKAAMLYDATTAQYTNLLTENYSFTTNKGNNTNRFTLFVTVERKKVPNITTGMDNLLANGQLSLIAVERTLVLSGLTENADIYVYDMSGKMVTGTHSAGENGIWRTTVPATGVYFVRVNSANSQQTLRTIVK